MKVLHILTDAVLAPQHLLYWPQTKTGKQMIAIFKRYNGSFTSAYYSSHREMHLNMPEINLDSVCSIHLYMGDRASMAVLVDSDINDDDLIYVCMIVDSDYHDMIVLYNRHEQLTEYIILNCEDVVDITVLHETYTRNQVFDSTSE